VKQNIVATYKYIHIEEGAPKPRTKVFYVYATGSGEILGEISWYANWRKYVFMVYNRSIYDDRCMDSLSEFTKKINKEHREMRKVERDARREEGNRCKD
jgi:hypothetical protein